MANNKAQRDDHNTAADNPKGVIAHHLSLLNARGLARSERALLDVRSPKSGTGRRNKKCSRSYR
ncbi:MAG TPA: hypothetical protein VH000_08985 [Rhizomicrobium sp.]|jgi:hypothetical protein|nr:hypothetical protein [Rhizomicrobium sp.]